MSNLEEFVIAGFPGNRGDLRRFLIKGGADSDAKAFYSSVTGDAWLDISNERIPFIRAIADYFNSMFSRGDPPESIYTRLSYFKQFMQWVDSNEIPLFLTNESLGSAFGGYSEYWYHKGWVKEDVKKATAYSAVSAIATILTKILDLPKGLGLKHTSRVVKSYRPQAKVSLSPAAEKQNLRNTQELGYFLVDVCNGLTVEAINGPLPINLEITSPAGSVRTVQLPLSIVKNLQSEHVSVVSSAKYACERRIDVDVTYEEIDSIRKGLIKLRLIAEFCIFIYQTGMNVTQALKIQRQGFSYKTKGDTDWLVRERKDRAGGTVEFIIYKQYKARFKDLISFVRHFYPNSPYLFPFGNASGPILASSVSYKLMIRLLQKEGIKWIPPRTTRSTRLNFLDRKVGNSSISAEMAQHVKETFAKNYRRPSQQQAMASLTEFWGNAPVSLVNGGCNGVPEACDDKPAEVIAPNCISDSGCLWCKNHRDISSPDYVWSLASLRRLKLIEAAQPVARDIPADAVISRLTDKLDAFKALSEQTRMWVDEALLRIEEGNYHHSWQYMIKFWEPK